MRTIDQILRAAEAGQVEIAAREMFEEDAPGYLDWRNLDEKIRNEYRRQARQALNRPPS